MFYNELTVLKIRLEELYDIVDKFILIEATVTHSGNPKPLYYSENKEDFSKYNDKIIHMVTDFTEGYEFSKYIQARNVNWFKENYQRECAQIAIQDLNLSNDDIIITTDLDEIPKRSIIDSIKKGEILIQDDIVYSIEMVLYYYNIELTTPRRWYYAKLVNYKTYKNFELLNQIRFHNYTLIKDAGYHLSYFGDVKFIKNKVESFAESVDYTTHGKSVDHLKRCYDEDILHFNGEKLVKIPLENNDNVPEYFKAK